MAIWVFFSKKLDLHASQTPSFFVLYKSQRQGLAVFSRIQIWWWPAAPPPRRRWRRGRGRGGAGGGGGWGLWILWRLWVLRRTCRQVSLGACRKNCASGDIVDFVVHDFDQQLEPERPLTAPKVCSVSRSPCDILWFVEVCERFCQQQILGGNKCVESCGCWINTSYARFPASSFIHLFLLASFPFPASEFGHWSEATLLWWSFVWRMWLNPGKAPGHVHKTEQILRRPAQRHNVCRSERPLRGGGKDLAF